jgi:hypothetical protein
MFRGHLVWGEMFTGRLVGGRLVKASLDPLWLSSLPMPVSLILNRKEKWNPPPSSPLVATSHSGCLHLALMLLLVGTPLAGSVDPTDALSLACLLLLVLCGYTQNPPKASNPHPFCLLDVACPSDATSLRSFGMKSSFF